MAEERIGRFDFNDPVTAVNVALVEARAFKDKSGKTRGEPKYGLTLLLAPDSAELKASKGVALAVAKKAFPGLDMKNVRFPFKDGNKENARRVAKGAKPLDWQTDKVVLGARSKDAPRLSVVEGNKLIDLADGDVPKFARRFYNGVEVCVQVNFAAYGEAAAVDDPGNDAKPGVTAYLNMVLSTGKGARIGGSASASEAFKGYVGRMSAVDPTGDDDSLDDVM